MKKLAAIATAVGLALFSLTGCAQSGVKTSAEATPENPMVLTLAHGLSETHTVHIAMTEFAEKVKERTDGRIQIQIFPNGQLGSENENMEQLMSGVISMTIARGIAQIVNGNYNTDSIGEAAKGFRTFFYSGKILGIFSAFWIALVIWFIFNYIMSCTRPGRHIYATGSNIDAARLSGVNVDNTVIYVYVVAAFCACITGLITCASTGTGTMDAGTSYEMYAVAASVIGGVSTLGGSGILLGTVIGSGIWGVLQNGLQFAGAPVAIRNIVIGIIVEVAVLKDVIVRSGRGKSKKHKNN